MDVRFAPAVAPDAAVVAVPVAKGGGLPDRDGAGALIAAAAKAARFEGESGALVDLFVPSAGGARRLLLVGTGEGGEADWQKAGGALVAKLLTSGVTDLTIDVTGTGASAAAVSALAATAAQRAWRYDIYRTKLPEKQKPTLAVVTIAGALQGVDAAWGDAAAVTAGMALTRTLVTLPPNILYPESFVDHVRKETDGLGLDITVLDEAAMRELGMGSLLGVSQGSVRDGRILAMKWNGGGEGAPTIAFVGKGVTFDTGGISIKPAAGMEDMKWDMGGAGAVAGVMKALALRKAKVNVVGVCGLVENMPDGNAQRPGDVVTSMSGQTIEVINTDAEGRLVLADAITWTQATFKPTTLIDLATLTGAMIISLGHEHAGLFTNDDTLGEQLLAAGRDSGDKLWRLPMSDAYDKLIDSPIADMKNVGPRGAGSITAAQFIKRFIDDGVKWAHLDIAGTVWADKPGSHHDKGATGYGVRLLDRFVAANFER
ncbi:MULTISPECIES: leucyl aminopeptidase [unclassified Sphingomonas]|jgi:leucyl aminopeptidase|uniref:leucyl aminopeptidase n=1 Tax=unclassified Sphingomonas TaxID=196159 RepID=UPI000E10CFCE|nr:MULTISPECIES: leucyl aminopeptidase [unclassified Sphingomonas]AXJ96562.1 leucyl aminopeptidase [Sphingomonas sp. FARSPH]